MRQVPVPKLGATRICTGILIGDGRLARHLRAYFTLESIPFTTWNRKQSSQELESLAQSATHVYLAISDGAIESFLIENPFLKDKVCVHFSGALVTPLAASAHPLMTFSDEIYLGETYRSIPFVLEKDRGSLESLLPGLTNQSFAIDPEKKVLYHSLCVMSGNFTVLLWEKVFQEFQTQLGLPKEVLTPYLNQIAQNLSSSPAGKSVLTGPIARGDTKTIEHHLSALSSDPYKKVYEAFVDAHAKSRLAGGSL